MKGSRLSKAAGLGILRLELGNFAHDIYKYASKGGDINEKGVINLKDLPKEIKNVTNIEPILS